MRALVVICGRNERRKGGYVGPWAFWGGNRRGGGVFVGLLEVVERSGGVSW